MEFTTDFEFCTETKLTKLKPVDNCDGESPTIHIMVTHKPQDGHAGYITELQFGT